VHKDSEESFLESFLRNELKQCGAANTNFNDILIKKNITHKMCRKLKHSTSYVLKTAFFTFDSLLIQIC